MDFLDTIGAKLKDALLKIPVVKKTVDCVKSIPTHMDYEGQKKAERLYQVIITLFGVVGFIYGFVVQQFSQTVYILAAGFILSCILVLPPWPCFRRNPLPWQKVEKSDETEKQKGSGKSKDTKKKKAQ